MAMRGSRTRVALIVGLALAAGVIAGAQQSPTPPDREASWRQDLTYFAREFSAAHKDFDKLYPRARFDAALASVTGDVPTATDANIVLGLMRLVASAHVGHTNLRLPMDGPLAFHRLPMVLQWFADGLAVTAATAPYKDALGLRITAIGTLSPERLEAAVAPYVSYETDAWLRLQSRTFMVAEEVLRAVGQVGDDGRVAVTFARADGTTFTLRLAPIPWRDSPFITAVDALGIPRGPERIEPNRYYRWEILPGTSALYIRYNRCADDPQQPFAAFVREIFAAVDAKPNAIDRVIVDLRANGGGDSRVIQPLLDGLRARKALSSRGRLYTLVGPATFSSGLMAAVELRNSKAILVGEAPGEKPNSYGEVRTLTLPNSRLVVQYSTKYFRMVKDKNAESYDPDLKVTRSIADWLGGKDPVLDAALRAK